MAILIIIIKQSTFYFHILTLNDHLPCHLIILIFLHGRGYGRDREMELGHVEREMPMIIDIYPFIFIRFYFLSYFGVFYFVSFYFYFGMF